LRELAPQVLGAVVRRFRDFAAAEDAVQEASLAAAMQWPRDGLPDNPRAWLTQAAFRRMADHIRSESARRRREGELALEEAYSVESTAIGTAPQEDDTLVLSATLPKGSVGPYQLQSAIAAVHDEAARADETDWPQILALYDLLRRLSDNPMVTLNHAVAAAMVHGPTKGLELLDPLKAYARLADHRRLDAVRAHLLELAGDRVGAVRHYRAAAGKTASLQERKYLLTQAARLSIDQARPSADNRCEAENV
jgi:predicted RNA polymerase sigma factor